MLMLVILFIWISSFENHKHATKVRTSIKQSSYSMGNNEIYQILKEIRRGATFINERISGPYSFADSSVRGLSASSLLLFQQFVAVVLKIFNNLVFLPILTNSE